MLSASLGLAKAGNIKENGADVNTKPSFPAFYYPPWQRGINILILGKLTSGFRQTLRLARPEILSDPPFLDPAENSADLRPGGNTEFENIAALNGEHRLLPRRGFGQRRFQIDPRLIRRQKRGTVARQLAAIFIKRAAERHRVQLAAQMFRQYRQRLNFLGGAVRKFQALRYVHGNRFVLWQQRRKSHRRRRRQAVFF